MKGMDVEAKFHRNERGPEQTNSKKGRPTKDSEERPSFVRIGLYSEDREILQSLPWNTDSEKVRNCVRRFGEMYFRERRQAKKLEETMLDLKRVAFEIKDPNKKNQRASNIEKFNNLYNYFGNVLNLFEFSHKTLESHFSKEAQSASRIVYAFKCSIDQNAYGC